MFGPVATLLRYKDNPAEIVTRGAGGLVSSVYSDDQEFIERMVVLAVPLAGLLLPLFKAVPAIYKWRMRRRLLYWYGRLKALESVIDDTPTVARRPAASRPPHFQASVARWRSREPSRVSTSLPASGGSGWPCRSTSVMNESISRRTVSRGPAHRPPSAPA